MSITLSTAEHCAETPADHRPPLRLRLWAMVWFALLTCAFGVSEAQAREQLIKAETARVETTSDGTVFRLGLSKGVVVEVFTLSDPYRVVLDMPDVRFAFPKGTVTRSQGLVKAFRYGLFAPGKARIVLDTAAPVWIDTAEMQNVGGGGKVELSLKLVKVDAKQFGQGTGVMRQKRSAAAKQLESDAEALTPKRNNRKPVVVVDPGHGGVDPGAVASDTVYEKNIVLDVSKALVRQLKRSGDFAVHATRTADVFMSLDDRLAFSRDLNADLFISLHADSLADTRFASRIRGATVYTLPERASDNHARLMAEKENRSDLIAGLPSVPETASKDVTSILIDLMKRETADYATVFSRVLVGKLKGSVPVSKAARRSAAFKVLKQTRTPSVLIELGYLSNVTDRKMMQTKAWQTKAARAISAAVSSYFAKRTARAD
ncbi:MAG: N-acetylmuramoyl-L-alanine amidase [Pseudomonadota bacterium]